MPSPSTARKVQQAMNTILAAYKAHGIPLVQTPEEVDVPAWEDAYGIRWRKANAVRDAIRFIRSELGRVPYPPNLKRW